MKIISPETEKEFNAYYKLRYDLLRKPWNQPVGSEKDSLEKISFHKMVIGNNRLDVLAVGRIQINSHFEAQIRFMAVSESWQGKGLGTQIITSLEDVAKNKNIKHIILQSRENAIKFYESNNYRIIKKTYTLYDQIQHWLMMKEIKV